MSHKFRKLAAASLAIVCTASMCGCSDSGYIGTVNGIEIPNGMYIFYVAVNGYSEAASKIKEEQGDTLGTAEVTVFNNTIEGKSASAWLKDHAVEKLRRYAAIEDKFNEFGLSLTDDEKSKIDSTISSLDDDLGFYAQYYGLSSGESSFGEHYENMGIGKSTLRLITESGYKENAVFMHYYDTDGLTPVTDDEINSYITENYASVKLLKLSFTDYQGLVLKEDADIQEVKDLAQKYADRFNETGDWSEIQYDYDLRQAQFDAWVSADDSFTEEAEGTAEPSAQEQPAPATIEADAASGETSAEAAAPETAEAPADGTADASTAEAPAENTEVEGDTIFTKPIVTSDNAKYAEYAQAAIDAATAEKKDADSCDKFIKKDSSTLGENITEYIWNTSADGKATLFTDDSDNCIYVVVREDITTKDSWKTEQHENILHAIKDDAFDDLLKEVYQNYTVELNDYLVNTKYAPEKLKGIGE